MKKPIPNFDGIIDYFTYWNTALTATMIGILARRIASSNSNARVATANDKPHKKEEELKKKLIFPSFLTL